ncbi:hypothetical protein ILUMI_13077 [Ignelater luminosus]|uniref:Uncharacterized protein n=1 Tax=Ignelater luminosus TaxID=2038154 RepID=A0A8K0CZ72_IGNLU|nr:hypothetical protein ILUMI_13077 [Ignelater luminosus]
MINGDVHSTVQQTNIGQKRKKVKSKQEISNLLNDKRSTPENNVASKNRQELSAPEEHVLLTEQDVLECNTQLESGISNIQPVITKTGKLRQRMKWTVKLTELSYKNINQQHRMNTLLQDSNNYEETTQNEHIITVDRSNEEQKHEETRFEVESEIEKETEKTVMIRQEFEKHLIKYY